MLTHKHIVAASLIILTVLASLMSIYPVKAATFEMPPYEDKRELDGGSNYPDAEANITDGHLQVWFAPLIAESAGGSAKVWSTIWCPATEITISYSYRIKGWLKCVGFLSAVGADLLLLVENSDWKTIYERTLFHKYEENNYELAVDEADTDTVSISIPEAGYYRFCAQLGGKACSGIGLAMCDFYSEEDEGAWVSMSIGGEYYTLSISTTLGGTTSPAPGTYGYNYGESVLVTASANLGWKFYRWTLDGATAGYDNQITVTMNSDHTLKAYFEYMGGGGGDECPMLYVYDGSEYVYEGLLEIHNPEGIDVIYEHTLVTTPQRVNRRYLLRLTEHPQTHSYIDQVKLYATLESGTTIELPLIHAWHSEDGNVLPQLLFSDECKTDTLGADHNNGTSQSIDLKFAALSPNVEITGFIFQIEGNNPEFKI